MITIHESTATSFGDNGLATLAPLSCPVTEILNGDHSLTMQHPIDGEGLWEHIAEEAILKVPSHSGDDLFRIYKVDRSISMMLTVHARHISYDLLYDMVENNAPTNSTASQALVTALDGTGFSGYSNLTAINNARWVRKSRLACIMGEEDNSIVNRWGGEIRRRQKQMDVLDRVGTDGGVSIRYRKNLTGLDIHSDISGVFTRIMPTGLQEDGQTVLTLPEKYVHSPLMDNYTAVRTKHIHYGDIRPGDGYDTLEDVYTALRARVQAEFDAGLDKPTVTAKVSFVDLSQTVEYEQYNLLESVGLGDTVHIWHEGLGVDASARVVSVKWDAIRKRYEQIVIGNQLANYLVKLNEQNRKLQREIAEHSDRLQQAIDEATETLNNPGDSYVRFFPSIASPAEIYIMDAPEPENAQGVFRLNRQGWGISKTGIYGPFTTAATFEGMVATAITTGVLNADLITTGSINASLITTGILNASLIKAGVLDAGVIAAGVLDAARATIINLNASNITSGTIDASQIGVINLNASNIVTGALDAGLITTGTLDASQASVVNLNASSIASGQIDASRIGVINLNADNITAGSMSAERLQIGTKLANLLINENGLSYGNALRIMTNEDFVVGGLRMGIDTNHPFFAFEYGGMRAVFIGEGAMIVDQVLQAEGPAYFNGVVNMGALEDIEASPNLYIDDNGKLWRATGSSGGGTNPTPAQTATTKGTNVNIRVSPLMTANIVYKIPQSGTRVEITGSPALSSDGSTWYPVSYQAYTGFIRSDLLTLT